MNQIDQAYIGLDLHASTSVFGVIDQNGHHYKGERVATDPNVLKGWLANVPADRKQLAIEEGPLTQWIGGQLAESVDELIACDPKQNFLISRSARKADGVDAIKLARLLRVGELAPVWHPPEQNPRALFRRWGTLQVGGEAIYSPKGRVAYLAQVEQGQIRRNLRSYYAMMDQALAAQQAAKANLCQLGADYWEIPEFKKGPGVGQIGAHLFSALVQNPHRFGTASKLWSWSGLAVTDRSSDGKPLGYERLDPSGRTEIKDISYRAWKAGAMQAKQDNEVKRFYQASLQQTGKPTNARLNTQGKILKAIWTIWKKHIPYDPQRF